MLYNIYGILKKFLDFRFQIGVFREPEAQFVITVYEEASGKFGQTVYVDIR